MNPHFPEFRDCVVSCVQVQFGTWDRLRILLGGTAHVRVAVHTEHVVGHTNTARTEASATWPRWLCSGAPDMEAPR